MVQGQAAGLKAPQILLLGVLAGIGHAWAQAWPATGQALGSVQVVSVALLAWAWCRIPHGRNAALLGWAFATAQGTAGTWWLYVSMHQYGGLSAPLAALAVLALAAALACYFALFMGLATVASARSTSGGRLLAFSGAWLCAELARAQWFTGFPWVAGGYAHVDSALAVLAPYVGVYGMGWVAACLGFLLAWAWGLRRPLMRSGAWVMSLALLLALGQAWRATDSTQVAATVPLTLLQGNVPQDQKYTAQRESAMAWYLDQMRAAPPGLVLAPEIAFVYPTATWNEAIWRALRPTSTDRAVWMGAPWQDPQHLANSVLAWAGTDGPAALGQDHRYDKHHLVPFGEFIPPGFGWFVRALNIPMGEFARGALPQATWRWGGLNWAPNICYEDLFGEELAHALVGDQAAHVLVNFSNIAWFGDTVAQAQHLNISRLRTLELQRPMVRVTNTGTTAVIDHQGQVVARLPTWTRDVLRAQVTGREGPPTWYARWVTRWGLWPLWVWGFLLILLPAVMRRVSR